MVGVLQEYSIINNILLYDIRVDYIMSKSSTSVNRKALKLDNKVKAINHCDVGKSCRAVGEEMGVGRTQIMNILKRKCEILDDFENNASSSTSCYWKLYFCLLNILTYLFVCFIQIISYWDNFINNKCKRVILRQEQNNK